MISVELAIVFFDGKLKFADFSYSNGWPLPPAGASHVL